MEYKNQKIQSRSKNTTKKPAEQIKKALRKKSDFFYMKKSLLYFNNEYIRFAYFFGVPKRNQQPDYGKPAAR